MAESYGDMDGYGWIWMDMDGYNGHLNLEIKRHLKSTGGWRWTILLNTLIAHLSDFGICVSYPGPHFSQVRCCDTPGGCKGKRRRLAKERQRLRTAITKCTAPGSNWVSPSFLKSYLGTFWINCRSRSKAGWFPLRAIIPKCEVSHWSRSNSPRMLVPTSHQQRPVGA